MSHPQHPNSHTHPPLTIPQFSPLPPDTFLNRLINKLLAPLFYLLFTIITSIVVVPIYTIVENFKRGATQKRSSRHGGGARVGRDYSREAGSGNYGVVGGGRDKGKGGGTLGDYLRGWSGSYEGKGE